MSFNPWLSRRENLNYPDLLFDLDPGSQLPFLRLCEAATVVKGVLDAMGVNSGHSSYGASSADSERHLDHARLMFEQTLSYGKGLFAEEPGPSGEALGNFPQAFTHLALIIAAFNLDRALGGGG